MKKKYAKKMYAIMLLVAIITTMIIFAVSTQAAGKNVVVYFPNWGIYNTAHNSMTVGQIPWDRITHINHAFFEVDASYKLATTDSFADFDKMMEHSEGWEAGQLRGHFGEYKYYKEKYPGVKVLISVGGWTRGQNFHAMASTSSSRAVFINSCIEFLKKYPFIDGFDLDWEYPGINRTSDPNDQYDKGCPGGPEDKENFTSLLKEIRAAYDSNGLSNKLLTIAGPAGYDKLDLQEPGKYHTYLDFINVMTYDIHGAWEKVTNHHSPLYKNPDDPSGTSPVDIKNRYNTHEAMKNYLDKGVPASKLNVGTPYYSRGWSGVDSNTGKNGLYANTTGAAVGTWDNPQSPGGQYPYFAIKTMVNNNGYTRYYDDVAKAVYLYNSSAKIMLSYEDETSLTDKCEYVLKNNFAGMIAWEISGDDPNGFPLTSLIFKKMTGGIAPSAPANTSVSASSGIITSPSMSPGTYSEWNVSKIYINGDTITYKSKIYKAKWWTQGEVPGASDVWELVSSSQTTSSSGKTTTSNSIVTTTPTSSSNNINTWAEYVNYKLNDPVTYKGINYTCRMAHTSLPGWEPPNVPALWLKK